MNELRIAQFVSRVMGPENGAGPAYWFVFQEDRLLVRSAGEQAGVLLTVDGPPAGLSLARQLYMGYLEGAGETPIHCYAGELAADAPLAADMIADGLRQLYPQLGETMFGLASRASQLITWDRTHQYCGRCGTATVPSATERARHCPRCGLAHFPRLSPAIIIAVVRRTPEGTRLLLAHNRRFPPGRYSVIAGFVEVGETLEECARREVREEVGIEIKSLRYFGSQSWPFPHSLMIGFTAEYAAGELVRESEEIAHADWFAADALPGLPPKMSIARRLIDWFVAGGADAC